MLETIEKLLILQERDRKINRVQHELAHVGPERDSLTAKAASTQARLETARTRLNQIETERKRLDLDIEAKKSLIEKYANQQLLTRKNEEYRALSHEIEMAREAIFKIEDVQIGLMEQTEAAQKELAAATQEAAAAKKRVEDQITLINQREVNLKKEFAALQVDRAQLAAAVDETVRHRYDRLLKSKGDNIVVGIDHGVCGGCHMKLPAQAQVTARSQQEVAACPNCGRIVYFSSDMDMTPAD